jgi:hypothetical protein
MLNGIHRQNGYGAHKRHEHCQVCWSARRKVGTWRAVYDDGTVRFFCDDHVTDAFAAASPPAPVEPAPLSTP